MIRDFLVPLLIVGLSEFGDKTQLAVLSMSSRFKHKLNLFVAVMLAFALVDGLAVLFGGAIARFIPVRIIHIIAGIVFIGYGVYILITGEGSEEKNDSKSTFFSAFSLILLLEMGDKSQIATAVFAAEFNPFLVFAGVMVALSLLTLTAMWVGHQLGKVFQSDKLKYVSALLFIGVGILSLVF